MPWAERAALPSLPLNERSRLRHSGHLFGAFLDRAFAFRAAEPEFLRAIFPPARRFPSPVASAPISGSGSQARRRR